MGVVGAEVNRFSIWQVNLSPTRGSEQAGFRPALVVSPDEMNRHLNTVIVAPMTTRIRAWPTRVAIQHAGKSGEVALDQLRTIDKARLSEAMGALNEGHRTRVLEILQEMFAA